MNAFAKACRVTPDPSRRLLTLLLGAYGAIGLLLILSSSASWHALLLAWAGSAAATYWHHFGPGRIVCVEFVEENRWRLDLANGWSGEAVLLPTSLVIPGLMVLNFRLCKCPLLCWRYRSLCLLNDSLGHDSARRLRVFLRFH